MNERIRELAEQAGYEKDMFGIGHWDMPEFKKFAELLIQKCVAISDDYVKDCTCEEHINCKHPRSAIGRKIREHFGVKR
jgi:hypothetical protein